MTFVVIKCGSAARGDTNANSDKDIICIWKDSKPNFGKLEQKHGKIMFYPLETILKMKKMGSLFLSHLDIDGIYIEGDNTLASAYKDFRPNKKSLEQNIKSTIRFIEDIEWYPDSRIGLLWVMDVIYVATRNIIFCSNAIEGKFLFSYEAALRAFGLNQEESNLMLNIREGKYAYRKETRPLLQLPDISRLNEVISEITKAEIKLKAGGVSSFEQSIRYDYWTERLVERAIINNEIYAPEFLIAIKNHNYNKSNLKKITKNILKNHRKKNGRFT